VAEVRPFLIQFLAETEGAMSSIKELVGAAGLASVPSTALWAGAALEDVMIDVGTAIETAGGSVANLTDKFHSLGYAAGPLLEAAAEGAKAGIAGLDLARWGEEARKWGIVTHQSTEEAARGMAKMVAAGGYSVEQTENLNSSMFALTERYRVSTASLQNNIVALGGAAQVVGFTENAIMGFTAALAQNNLVGMPAQRVIGSIIDLLGVKGRGGLALARAVRMTNAEMEIFNDSTADQKAVQFMDKLGQLAKTDRIYAEGVAKNWLHLNPQRTKQLLDVAGKTGGLTKMIEEAAKAEFDHAEITREYNDILTSLNGSLKRMWEKLKAVGEVVGTMLLPVVKALTGLLSGMVTVLESVPTPILAIGAGVAGLMGAFFAVHSVTKLLKKAFSSELLGKLIPSLGGACGATKNASACIGGLGMKTVKVSKQISSSQLAIANAFKAMGGGTGLGKISQSVGAAGLSASVATPAVWSFTGALSAMWAAAWPVLVVILALVAAAAVVYVAFQELTKWWKAGGAAVQWFKAQWKDLVGDFDAAGEALKPVTDSLSSLWDTLKELWEAYKPFLLTGFFVTLFPLLMPLIAGVVVGFLLVKAALKAIKVAGEQMGLNLVIDMLRSAFERLKKSLTSAWDAIKGAFNRLNESLGGAINWMNVLKAAVFVLAIPFVLLIAVVMGVVTILSGLVYVFSFLVDAIVWGAGIIGKALYVAFYPLIKAYEAVMYLKNAMFGSSMFHIKEGVKEVSPSLKHLQHAFIGVQKAAVGVDMDQTLPDEGGLTRARSAVVEAAMSKSSGSSGGGGSRGGSRETTAARITIPVSVELDGMILARVVAEHLVELGNERNFNEPNFPLRGIEPA